MTAFQQHEPLIAHDLPITCLKFGQASGKLLVTGSKDTTINCYKVTPSQLKPVFTLRGHTAPLESVILDPHERTHILSSSTDQSLKLWDIVTGKVIRNFDSDTLHTHTLHIHPTEPTQILTLSDDGAHIFDTRFKKSVLQFTPPRGTFTAGAFCNGGVVSATDHGMVQIWNTRAADEALVEWFAGGGAVSAVAVNPDVGKVATAAGGLVKVWETTGLELEEGTPSKRRGVGGAKAIRWSEEERLVAAMEGGVRVYSGRGGIKKEMRVPWDVIDFGVDVGGRVAGVGVGVAGRGLTFWTGEIEVDEDDKEVEEERGVEEEGEVMRMDDAVGTGFTPKAVKHGGLDVLGFLHPRLVDDAGGQRLPKRSQSLVSNLMDMDVDNDSSLAFSDAGHSRRMSFDASHSSPATRKSLRVAARQSLSDISRDLHHPARRQSVTAKPQTTLPARRLLSSIENKQPAHHDQPLSSQKSTSYRHSIAPLTSRQFEPSRRQSMAAASRVASLPAARTARPSTVSSRRFSTLPAKPSKPTASRKLTDDEKLAALTMLETSYLTLTNLLLPRLDQVREMRRLYKAQAGETVEARMSEVNDLDIMADWVKHLAGGNVGKDEWFRYRAHIVQERFLAFKGFNK